MAAARETTSVRSGDADICVESIGHPGDPAILLIAGGASSMDWWEDELCELLAGRGLRVIRYDNRDTGRSTTYPPGAPGYTGEDLVDDAVAILDALSVDAAHVAGLSMGGALAQVLALEHRERVKSLTLISTSAVVGEGPDLPGMDPELGAAFAEERPEPDWSDRDAVIDHLVEVERPFAGSADFDEQRSRVIAGRVFDRSNDLRAADNHGSVGDAAPEGVSLADLEGLPTLVVHGALDPMFPPAHGRAIAAAIPGARLVELEDVGHQYPPERHWTRFADLLVEQVGSQDD